MAQLHLHDNEKVQKKQTSQKMRLYANWYYVLVTVLRSSMFLKMANNFYQIKDYG